MVQKTVTVTIDENGDSRIDLNGFVGRGCDQVLAEFAGRDRIKLQRAKPEYHIQTKEKQARERKRS